MVLQPVSSVLNGFVQRRASLEASDELEKVLCALRSIEASLAEDGGVLIKKDKHPVFDLRLQRVQDIAHEVLDLLGEWQQQQLLQRKQGSKREGALFKKKRASAMFVASRRRRPPPAFED
ncbi:hypothetical protein H6P81_001469 [Aristolochia fimbriata]|uniref:Uncharacterized protein n=1 Tax=Aristolochia fimbriata TaxID=158543 RepID=A0AAV7FAV3_ARIFI|nr:hypothetical protein H6P81_001469 [Aristolochia fimbriata]